MSTLARGFRTEIMGNSILHIDSGKVLDNNNAHEMFELITNAQSEGMNRIIVDMHELEFLSSAGVGSLLGTVDASRGAGGDIVLCNVGESILHILDVLDLTTYMTIASDIQAAQDVLAENNN
ncbi:MAG: STAS domain-containing protein [Candidatus Zixiibacteriota bacterium]